MLEKRPAQRLPSVARAAASPSAIVMAGAGVAAGEAAHLGLAAAIGLGAAGYGVRLAWAYARRKAALRRRAVRRSARVDPWAVPEPWRGLTARAVRARKQLQQFARDCPPGPLAEQLARASAVAAAAVEEQWSMARAGAALGAPLRGAERVAADLEAVQGRLRSATAAERPAMQVREEQLAAELRSLRRSQAAADELAGGLGLLVERMEQLAADSGRLLAAAVPASSGLASVSAHLEALVTALDEVRAQSGGGSEQAPGP